MLDKRERGIMRKKYCVCLLLSVLILGLCACGVESKKDEETNVQDSVSAEEKSAYEGFNIFPDMPRPDEIPDGYFGASRTSSDEMMYIFQINAAAEVEIYPFADYFAMLESYGFTVERKKGLYDERWTVTRKNEEIADIVLGKWTNETVQLAILFFNMEGEPERYVYEGFDVFPDMPRPDEIPDGYFGASRTLSDETVYFFQINRTEEDDIIYSLSYYVKMLEKYGFTVEPYKELGGNFWMVKRNDEEIAILTLTKEKETLYLAILFS